MTQDYFATIWEEVRNWKPAKDEPRPGSAEFYFAQGVAAFLAGEPLSKNPHKKHGFEYCEWEFGWKTRQFGKSNEFREYIKARTLFDQRYAPHHALNMLEAYQAARLRTIQRLEEAWPEFSSEYEKQYQRRKGY